jgi:hypothetical protein
MRTSSRVTFDTVRQLALAIPGAEEGIKWGVPAFLARGRMFACQPSHRSAEPDSVIVCIDFDRRDELLQADPETYYITDHYVGYPSVLVRLRQVHRDALADLLRMAYHWASSTARRPVKARKTTPRTPAPGHRRRSRSRGRSR